MDYNNALITITNVSTPDPYVTHANGKYYLTFTAGDRVEIWSSTDLFSLGSDGSRVTIWHPPPNTAYSSGIWAPELHAIDNRWYVYVAAEDPTEGNKSHRMYVLAGPPATSDPTNGPWEFLGLLRGLPKDQWAIDGTVITLKERSYFIYSGWPLNQGTRHSDLMQQLFIVELANATQVVDAPVMISKPDKPWEFSGDSGINEGPQFLTSPDGSWIGIAYSCAGSWTADYKMNTLQYLGGDPLNTTSWRKSRTPLLERNRRHGPFGPGHGSFVNVDGQTLGTFHATDRDDQGWDGRKARVQRVVWGRDGPHMGRVVGWEVGDRRAFWEDRIEERREEREESHWCWRCRWHWPW